MKWSFEPIAENEPGSEKMSVKNIAAFGLYQDQVTALEAVDALKHKGFRSTDMSILIPDNLGSKDFGHEKHTKAPAGAAAGALAGVLFGGVLGWLVGMGALGSTSWWGPFGRAEPIVTVLSGIGVCSMLGLLVGAFIGFAIPEYEARRYDGRNRNGGILVSVHCDNLDWTKKAKDVLRHSGANGVAARVEGKADFGASEKPVPRTVVVPPAGLDSTGVDGDGWRRIFDHIRGSRHHRPEP
jgi:hypothetical protein